MSGWSAPSLNQVFARQFGITIREYIVRTRITRAADLLASGEKTEVAMLLSGYHDRTAFSRTFQRYMAATPGDYRRQARTTQLDRSID